MGHGWHLIIFHFNFYFRLIATKASRRHDADTSSDLDSFDESDTESGTSVNRSGRKKKVVLPPMRRPSVLAGIGRHHYGSFYLRMGAVGEFDDGFLCEGA